MMSSFLKIFSKKQSYSNIIFSKNLRAALDAGRWVENLFNLSFDGIVNI